MGVEGVLVPERKITHQRGSKKAKKCPIFDKDFPPPTKPTGTAKRIFF
jgi:hypothetical protein